MALMRPGTPLFRAKWTAKEVYVHTRAFGVAAGARYMATRLRELQQRRAKPWGAGAAAPAGLDATVLIGRGLHGVRHWEGPVLQVGARGRTAAALIPLARTAVFSGSDLPRPVGSLLELCRLYGVDVVYVYGPRITCRNRASHRRLLDASRTTLYLTGGIR